MVLPEAYGSSSGGGPWPGPGFEGFNPVTVAAIAYVRADFKAGAYFRVFHGPLAARDQNWSFLVFWLKMVKN